jgi:uncharacterized protein RhaS with RHS repeats
VAHRTFAISPVASGYYAGGMGRFMSPDPILQNDLRLLNPQRWNKYAYAINNPLTLTDPTGKDAAFVDFSNGAGGAGHAGLISIRSDGTATYSAFLPGGGGQAAAYAPGYVQTQDLSPMGFLLRLPTIR